MIINLNKQLRIRNFRHYFNKEFAHRFQITLNAGDFKLFIPGLLPYYTNIMQINIFLPTVTAIVKLTDGLSGDLFYFQLSTSRNLQINFGVIPLRNRVRGGDILISHNVGGGIVMNGHYTGYYS